MTKKAKPDSEPVILPTPDEQAALPPEEDEGLSSLEGMVFSPYLDPADLDGTNWNLSASIPEMPVVDWDDPPIPDEFKPGIDPDPISSEPVYSEPIHSGPVSSGSDLLAVSFEDPDRAHEPDQSRRSAMDWLQPAEKIAEKITPLGRPAIQSPHPSLYGNLADSRWIAMDRPPILDDGDEDLSDQIPLRLDDAPIVTPANQELPALRVLESGHPLPVPANLAPEPAGFVSGVPNTGPPDQKPVAQLMLPAPSYPHALTVVEKEHQALLPPVPAGLPDDTDPPLFRSFYQPERKAPTEVRIPHLGHVAILLLLASIGLLGAGLLTRSALYFHLFGVSTVQIAMTDVHYTIGSMAALYLIAFGAAVLIFPLFWQRRYFAGVQWNFSSALRHVKSLLAAAGVCFILALVDEVVLPGPTNAPIDKLFDTRAAAWLLFAFGVTFAPFFEETIFRGFLLPALCTAFDWLVERATGNPSRPLDPLGHPQWSLAAMVFASVATSVPFALMHAEQTAWSLGPFLLLVAVSLVLSWARLSTRSLAASVLVHASYNFLLFSLMLLGTSGFRHLDKM